jgi:EpsD family peptidyl-prolyl cis-trans isomerase
MIAGTMKFKQLTRNSTTRAIVITLVCLAAVACGKKDPAATQVVASVDGEEISVHQINAVLGKAGGVTPENLPKAKVEVLGGLVEQQLAINLAVSKKLDRSPDVVAAIEAAKRDIIARAALADIAASLPKPTDEEAKKYFDDHPELFSQRRVFSLQELALRKDTPGIAQVREKVASAKSMDELAAWLKDKNIAFSANAGNRPAEQIPLEVLPKLHAFKDGQIGVIEANDSYLIVRLQQSLSQPVAEAKALPTIKLFLANQRGAEAVKAAKADMKAKAKINYFGEFAGGEDAFKAKAEAEAKAAAAAAEQTRAKAKADADALAKQKLDEQASAQQEAEARAKARADAREQSGVGKDGSVKAEAANLEKGIKGLK